MWRSDVSERTTTTSKRRRVSRLDAVRAIAALGLALGLGATGSFAYWSDHARGTGGTFTAGQLDVVVNGELATLANLDGTWSEASYRVDDLLPGESRAFMVTASNTGSGDIPFDLRMDAYATGALAPALRFAFYSGGAATNSDPATNVTATTYRTGSCSGTQLIGPLVTLGASAASPTTIIGTKLDTPVGTSHDYCVRVTLDNTATTWNDASKQGAQGVLTMVFRGTQKGQL